MLFLLICWHAISDTALHRHAYLAVLGKAAMALGKMGKLDIEHWTIVNLFAVLALHARLKMHSSSSPADGKVQ